MKDLIEYMARAIVEYPDEVVVTEEEEEDHNRLSPAGGRVGYGQGDRQGGTHRQRHAHPAQGDGHPQGNQGGVGDRIGTRLPDFPYRWPSAVHVPEAYPPAAQVAAMSDVSAPGKR